MSMRQAEELRSLQDQLGQLGRGVGPAMERVVSTMSPTVRTVLGYAALAAEYLPQLRQLLGQAADSVPAVKAALPQGALPRPGRTRVLAAGVLLGAGALIYAGMRSRAAQRRG